MIQPNISIDSVIAFDFSTVRKIPIVNLPTTPDFTSSDGWRNLAECLRIETGQIFPHGMCRVFSAWLFLFIAMNFEGRLDSDSLIVKIEGREAKIIPRRTYHGFKRHYTDHYFLELVLNDEQWIIDPTWKQFVHAGHFMDRWGVNYSDPFNRFLLEQNPDILIAKRQDLFDFLENLGNSIRWQDSLTAEKIIECIPYWKQEGKPQFDEFKKLIIDLTIPDNSLEGTKQFYGIHSLELFWPILQVACHHPSISLEDFCKQLLQGSKQVSSG